MAEVIDLFLARMAAKRKADDALIDWVLGGTAADASDIVDVFCSELETIDDDESRFLCLLQLFADADDQGRAMLNNLMQSLCGWTLPDLVRMAAGQRVDAKK